MGVRDPTDGLGPVLDDLGVGVDLAELVGLVVGVRPGLRDRDPVGVTDPVGVLRPVGVVLPLVDRAVIGVLLTSLDVEVYTEVFQGRNNKTRQFNGNRRIRIT